MARVKMAVALVGMVLVVCFAAAPSALADGLRSDAVGIEPAAGSRVDPKGFFLLEQRPGETTTQTVHITNGNSHAVSVHVDPIEAVTANATGVVFAVPGSPRTTTSKWITVSVPELTLQPNEARDVTFTVRVPDNATSGQYVAGVSAWVPLPEVTKPTVGGGRRAAFAMDLQFNRAVAVEIDVPGPRAPQLVVTGAEPRATPKGIALEVHIANKGNAFAHGTGVIRVPDTNTDFSFPIETFVSHTAIVFQMVPWTSSVVPGTHQIEVDLTYEGGRRVSWTGTVTISGAEQSALEAALAKIRPPSSGNGSNPWLILGLLLVPLFIAGALYMRRRSDRGPVFVTLPAVAAPADRVKQPAR
jgi:hypothetical protein